METELINLLISGGGGGGTLLALYLLYNKFNGNPSPKDMESKCAGIGKSIDCLKKEVQQLNNKCIKLEATMLDGSNESAIYDAMRDRVSELETRLLERIQATEKKQIGVDTWTDLKDVLTSIKKGQNG